jgi:hypothetical protein
MGFTTVGGFLTGLGISCFHCPIWDTHYADFKFIRDNTKALLLQIAPLLITLAIFLGLVGQANAMSPPFPGNDCSNATAAQYTEAINVRTSN